MAGAVGGQQLLEAADLRVDIALSVITASGGSRPSSARWARARSRVRAFGLGVLAGVQLDVRVAGVVVDDAVQVVEADAGCERRADHRYAMAGPIEAGEPLHIDVQQRARPRPLVAA